MSSMFPSINHENINNLSQEEPPPLLLHFPSPFLDDMDTTTMLPNLHHSHHHHISTNACPPTTTTATISTAKERLPSKLKCVRKKRCAGKKDRHSKIHTAQGLRDRRMRLSVHTARKFFDLNDMLGFDKASKTIEWLFSKSKEAIDEVTETLQSDDPTQTVSMENNLIESPISACETESVMEIEDQNSRKPIETYPMIMEHIKKPKQLFQVQSQLGFSENLDNHLEYSNAYHFLKNLHLDNRVRNPDTYLENITSNSSTNCSIHDYNKTIDEPPAGWLNSRNTFLGFLGGWDSENSRMESNNEIVSNIAPLRSCIIGENPNSGLISSNFVNFHSQNQEQ